MRANPLLAAVLAAAFPALAWGVIDGRPDEERSRPTTPPADLAPVLAASVRIEVVAGSQPLRWCSGTVVGPRAVLTAASCLAGDPGLRRAMLQDGGTERQVPLTCQSHPDFRLADQVSPNFALCALAETSERPFPQAAIAAPRGNASGGLRVGEELFLVGFGCRQNSAEERRRAATAPHAVRASVTPGLVKDPERQGMRFVVVEGAAGCFGDSGGGVFRWKPEDGGRWELIGVITASDLTSRTQLVPVAAGNVFSRWSQIWSAALNAPLCARTASRASAPECRDAAPPLPRPAEAARPVALQALSIAPQEGLYDALIRACGDDTPPDPAWFDGVRAHLDAAGGAAPLLAPSGEARQAEVPACPPRRTMPAWRPHVVEAERRTLPQLFADSRRVARAEGHANDFEEADEAGIDNEPDILSTAFLPVFKAINPQLLAIADLDWQRLPAGTRVRLPLGPLRGQPIARRLHEFSSGPSAAQIMAVPLSGGAEACPGRALRQDVMRHPYDVSGLLQVLAANAAFRRFDAPARVRVLVVDGGLQRPDDAASPFMHALDPVIRYLPTTERELRMSGLGPDQGWPGDAWDHGTQVSSLVLGGPLMANIFAAENRRWPRIELEPFPVFELVGTEIRLPLSRLEGVTQRLDDVDIINISLHADGSFRSLFPSLETRRRTLIVAAAGNQGFNSTQGQVLDMADGRIVIPAAFAQNHDTVLAVAATYQDEAGRSRIAPFSNANRRWVRIGAPGCDIPVLTYDREAARWSGGQQRVNGTSFSAPLVSFTAAMLKSEVPALTARGLVQRILVSADVDVALAPDIEHGRVLNPVKALALFEDVVEFAAAGPTLAPGPVAIGTVQFFEEDVALASDATLTFTCADNETRRIRISDILKIAPQYAMAQPGGGTEPNPLLVYFRQGSGQEGSLGPRFLDARCQVPARYSIELRGPRVVSRAGETVRGRYRLGEIRDLVPRLRTE